MQLARPLLPALLALTLLPVSALAKSGGRTYVRGYYRKDGTYVRPHVRGGGSSSYSSRSYSSTDYRSTDYRSLGLNRDGELGPQADLRGAKLAGKLLGQLNLAQANLSQADLSSVRCEETNLDEANLDLANLTRAHFRAVTLNGASLYRAVLKGIRLADTTAQAAKMREAQLMGAFLEGIILSEADLSRADLSEADLTGSNLTDAKLVEAQLSGAQLREADLSGADLTGAKLENADLQGAYYTADTRWPAGFDAAAHGAKLLAERRPLPAEETAVREPDQGVSRLIERLQEAYSKGNLHHAENLADQIKVQIIRKRTSTLKSNPDASQEGSAEKRGAETSAQSPYQIHVTPQIMARLHVPSGPAYIFTRVVPGNSNVETGLVKIEIPDALDAENKLFQVGQQVFAATYRSSDPTVVEVNERGQLKLMGPGKARVLVTLGQGRAEIPVEVVQLPFKSYSSKEEVVKQIGFPDQANGDMWMWNKYPGLRLITSPSLDIRCEWTRR